MKRLPRGIAAAAIVAAALFSAALASGTTASARLHPVFPYLWSATVTPSVSNLNITGDHLYIQSAASNYNAYTDLTVFGVCGSTCTSNIKFLQGNFGPTGWIGLTIPYTGGGTTSCVNGESLNGLCNTTSRRVDFAYVEYNTLYQGTIDLNEVWLPLHELGHVFGLAHPAISPAVTVMDPSGTYAFLTGFDIGELNGYY